jgi:hypothetical protein
MAVTQWMDEIKNRKVLTIFPTDAVKNDNNWFQVFKDSIVEFNKLSASLKLGVTFDSPNGVQRPDPVGEGGAEVQFDLGNGELKYEVQGQKFVALDKVTKKPINFSATALHGYTAQVSISFGGPGRMRRAFIFVPATPMVTAQMRVGPGPDGFRDVQRAAGTGVRRFIVVHEFIHACGLSDAEHNSPGPDADTFTINPTVSAGDFQKPDDDKILLRVNAPNPNVTAPPNFIKQKVADLIRNNWS